MRGAFMHTSMAIRDRALAPALFCAPLAELTHSAFRRLLAEIGGHGAAFTEMLSGRDILREDLASSPYTKRRAVENTVFYQLMFRPDDPVEAIVERISEAGPDGIDVNLACYAPVIRQLDAGAGLFDNLSALADILTRLRKAWPGPLTVKIRLGHATAGHEVRFVERLRVIEDAGIDAITLHVRFFEDKFKRRARHELFQWAATQTRLPLIANGDILSRAIIDEHPHLFAPVSGIMIGRMAVAQPWIFRTWHHPGNEPDRAGIWFRLCDYIEEDFDPATALKRIRLFTRYYARNYLFGHHFQTAIGNAPTLQAARNIAETFFGKAPQLHPCPTMAGL